MKRLMISRTGFLAALVLSVLAFAIAPAGAGEKPMKFKAQLIWGTNDDSSPNPDHKPIDPKLAKKLEKMPIKWKNYFQVTEKEFTVAKNATTKLQMSTELSITVRHVDAENVEVELFGKGKSIGKVTKSLGTGKSLLTGGDAKNYTAWFVFIKQVD